MGGSRQFTYRISTTANDDQLSQGQHLEHDNYYFKKEDNMIKADVAYSNTPSDQEQAWKKKKIMRMVTLVEGVSVNFIQVIGT